MNRFSVSSINHQFVKLANASSRCVVIGACNNIVEGSTRLPGLLLRLYHISIYDRHPDLSSRKIRGSRYKSEMRRLITVVIYLSIDRDYVGNFVNKK